MSAAPGAGLVDSLLEATVVGSFTRIGFHVRRRLFRWAPLPSLRLDGKVVVVTGATSGLGRWAAEAMAGQGARLCIVGRDAERTERAQAEIAAATGAEIETELADLSSLAETAALATRIGERHDRLDALVLNAGLLTHDFTVTPEGNELTLATHVLSQFLLTAALRPLLEASAPARVVITSSGGMYTQPLDVALLQPDAGVVQRHEGLCALQTGPGGADGGVDPAPAGNRRHRQRHASRLGRHARNPGRAPRLHPDRRTVPPHARRGCGHDRLARVGARAHRAQRPLLPRPPAADQAPPRPHAPPDEAEESVRLWQLCVERTAAFAAADAAAEPGHAARRARRRPGARPRLRQPRLPPRRARAASGGATTASAGSPAGSSSRAGSAAPLLQPGRFTELFFLDEATAFAAGHRPCALCRREDYDRFGELWRGCIRPRADAIDAQLHAERVDPATRAQRHHEAALDELPDGAFVLHEGAPWLVLGDALLALDAGRLHDRARAPGGGRATLITPPSLVAVLRAGWEPAAVPLLHPSAT